MVTVPEQVGMSSLRISGVPEMPQVGRNSWARHSCFCSRVESSPGKRKPRCQIRIARLASESAGHHNASGLASRIAEGIEDRLSLALD